MQPTTLFLIDAQNGSALQTRESRKDDDDDDDGVYEPLNLYG
jgi:hypothetical protein